MTAAAKGEDSLDILLPTDDAGGGHLRNIIFFAAITSTLVLAGCLSFDPDVVLPPPSVLLSAETGRALKSACASQLRLDGKTPLGSPTSVLIWQYDHTIVTGVSCRYDRAFEFDICEPRREVIAARDALVAEGLAVPDGCDRGVAYVAENRKKTLQPTFESHCLHQKPRALREQALCFVLANDLAYLKRVGRF